MSSSKPLLGYWNYRGYGNPIKYLLEYMSVDYDLKTYDQIVEPGGTVNRESWYKEKFNLGLDFPNVPYLIDGDVKLTESREIIKYLARKYRPELEAESEKEIQQLGVLDGRLEDLAENLCNCIYFNYTEASKKFMQERCGALIEQFSKYLGKKEWFLGKIKYVDFRLYEYLHFHRVFNPNVYKNYPNLEQFLERFENLPAIKKYMNSPRFISKPCFSPIAQFKM